MSVRSGPEARLAVEAGARIIDVKEPDLGSLGRAPFVIWQEVRDACPPAIPVSVALGELTDWLDANPPAIPPGAWSCLAFRKLGLARVREDWKTSWAVLRSLPAMASGPPWIAVAYADWQSAGAPDPDTLLEAAREDPCIVGVLVDTWSKDRPFQPDDGWVAWSGRVRSAGLILAIAGGLGRTAIPGLAPIRPDIVAVRGAACVAGRRRADLDPDRVAELARIVAMLPEAGRLERAPHAQSVPG